MSPIDIDVLADHDRKYFAISCLMFFCSRCPRAQPFVKVGALAPLCPMVSALMSVDVVLFHCNTLPLLRTGDHFLWKITM